MYNSVQHVIIIITIIIIIMIIIDIVIVVVIIYASSRIKCSALSQTFMWYYCQNNNK